MNPEKHDKIPNSLLTRVLAMHIVVIKYRILLENILLPF